MQTVHVRDQTEHILNCPTLSISLQILKKSQLLDPPLTKKRHSIKDWLIFHSIICKNCNCNAHDNIRPPNLCQQPLGVVTKLFSCNNNYWLKWKCVAIFNRGFWKYARELLNFLYLIKTIYYYSLHGYQFRAPMFQNVYLFTFRSCKLDSKSPHHIAMF